MIYEPTSEPKYAAGESVIIVDAEHCKFGCATSMLEFVGKPATIAGHRWSPGHECWVYYIEEDGRGWSWSDSCFQELSAEFEVESADAIMDFLMKG